MPSTGVRSALLVPRAWVIALAVLFVAPWLLLGALYVAGRPAVLPGDDPDERTIPEIETGAAPGPWGRLHLTPIVVSPPLEFVFLDNGPAVGPRWHFPGVGADDVEEYLQAAGLTPADAAAVRATARTDATTGALVVAPDPGLVRRLDRDTRARVYSLLARSRLNVDQAQAFRFWGSTADDWLRGSLISPDTRDLVAPLVYRQGEFLQFADLEVVRPGIRDIEELRRLVKALLRQATLLVHLRVEDIAEVGRLAEYWGRGGRRTDLRPLLESVAGGEGRIDITHLLPPMAREYLYRYPKLTPADFDRPVLANCLWTAMNFFAREPDDRFLDVTYALDRLKTDYYVVETGFELGDIVALLDEHDVLFHAVIYLADDLVLTKNGTSPVSPWIIVPLEHVTQFYAPLYRELRLIHNRRKDF